MSEPVFCSFSNEERAILEGMKSAFLLAQVHNGDAKTILVSDGICELFGLDRETTIRFLDSNRYTNIHPDDRVWVEQKVKSFYQFKIKNSNIIYRTKLYGQDQYCLINVDVKLQKMHGKDVACLTFSNLGLSTSNQRHFTKLVKEQQHQLIDSSLSGALVIKADNFEFLYSNQKLIDILGLKSTQKQQQEVECYNFFKEFFYPKINGSNLLSWDRINKKQEIFKDSRIFSLQTHEIIWEKKNAILLFINESNKHEVKTTHSHKYDHHPEPSQLGTWDWDIRTNKVKINEVWSSMLGLKPADEISYDFFSSLVSNNQTVEDFKTTYYRNGIEYFDNEFQMKHADGHYLWIFSQGRVAEYDENGNKIRVCGTHQDITHIKEQYQQLQYASKHDTLTKVANRLSIKNLLDKKIAKGRPLTLIFVDIFNMRSVNDSFSYEIGDQLLIKVAEILASLETKHLILGRLTDNGFALVYPTIEKEVIKAYSDAILEAFSVSININNDIALRVNIGVGISSFPNEAGTSEDLIHKANTAANYVRQHKLTSAIFYDERFAKESAKKMQIENIIIDALEHDYFYLLYQPQIQLSDQKLFGLEALIRCKHPDAGEIYPNDFIPIAEKSGLIHKIDLWVFKTACEQGKKWLDEGRDFGYLSINTTTDELQDPNYVSTVKNILIDTNFPADRLYIEVTERVVIDTPDYINDVFKQLQALGIKVAIDDFGTGYSSLSYLKKLNIQKLKIDRSFITHINRDDTQQQLVSTIISMATSLNLSVIAEGVETKKELDVLKQLGCDIIQGYYYSRPQPIDKLNDWF